MDDKNLAADKKDLVSNNWTLAIKVTTFSLFVLVVLLISIFSFKDILSLTLNENFGINSRPANIMTYILIFIFDLILLITMYFFLTSDNIKLMMVRMFAFLLFFISFSGVCFSILFHDFLPFSDEVKLKEIQVFMAVASSGMMGGMMRYFTSNRYIDIQEDSLWLLIHSAMIGMFVSVVLFLILKAGIINQIQVDTFNIWGVSGISSIIGFFSGRMINRFSNLFNDIIGKP